MVVPTHHRPMVRLGAWGYCSGWDVVCFVLSALCVSHWLHQAHHREELVVDVSINKQPRTSHLAPHDYCEHKIMLPACLTSFFWSVSYAHVCNVDFGHSVGIASTPHAHKYSLFPLSFLRKEILGPTRVDIVAFFSPRVFDIVVRLIISSRPLVLGSLPINNKCLSKTYWTCIHGHTSYPHNMTACFGFFFFSKTRLLSKRKPD